MRVPFSDLHAELRRVLLALGFSHERADLSARLFAEASRDGVASHGLNRFPRFVRQVRDGHVIIEAQPALVHAFGAWEQWDGRRGPGNLNAGAATTRASTLARTHGVGCVALANTNHWMRGGTYGWQAVGDGCALIAWTNTMPLMAPWGARDARVGNNPLVIAVPRALGPVVLDMAMSQFSFGRLEASARAGAMLPVPGGYDTRGALSQDAGEIVRSGRPLPIGFWKGTGLALLLDLLGGMLSGGQLTHQIARDNSYGLQETGLSQVFIAFDVARPEVRDRAESMAEAVIADLHAAAPEQRGGDVLYPGERVMRVRADSLANGVEVDEAIWNEVRAIS